MPTFSISGVLVARDGTDTNIAANPVTLEVVVPAGQTTFTYSVLEIFPDDLPEVDISAGDVAVGLSGAGVPAGLDVGSDDGATFLGTVTTTAGNFVALVIEVPRPGGGAFDAIFPIGGAVPAIPTNLAEFNALEGTVTGFATATGAFAPGATIDFGTLANTVFDASPNVVQGTDGDDNLAGTAGDDFIVTGEATPNGDFVTGSTGNDTIDTSDIGIGYVGISYAGLSGPIDVVIDGGANTGTVDKGSAGTDTLIGVEAPLFSGWTTGGLSIRGTGGDDSFDLTLQGPQWMSLRPSDGVDTIIINGNGTQRVSGFDEIGAVRLDMRDGNGIDVNLATGVIADDGFGNAETIQGNSPLWEVLGSGGNDVFLGSDNADSFRSWGGNDTLDGGDGFDRVRYDSFPIASVNIDAGAGTATGTLNGGGTFTDTISGFEQLRGSDGNDVIAGSAGDDRLEGRNGADTLDGAGGNDTLDGGSGSDWFTIRTGATTIADFELGTDVIDVQIGGLSVEARNTALRNATEDSANGGSVADFGNGNTLRFANLSAAEVTTLAEPEGPPQTSLFFKIDPTQAEEVFSIGALGLNPGDAFTIQLVGDFKPGVDFADNSQNGETIYNGNSFFSSNDIKAITEFSGDTILRFQNNDFPLDDNSDPDNDYGLLIESVLPELTGTEGDDSLFGDGSDNFLQGFGGNDTISGLSGNDTLLGGNGDDNLFGNDGDDSINPGDNEGGATGFDFIETGLGNDTVDMSDIVNGYVGIDYGFLDGSGNAITATIDGGANTGTVDKGSAGTDTLIGVEAPLFSGWTTGGLSIRGTAGNDSFDLTPQGQQWMSVRGGAGTDSYTINGTGLVRMDFRDATQGIEVNLGTRQIADDGFGNAETIGGTGSVWEVYGSSGDDMFTGSGADESYRYFGGDNTLDGGAGFDRLRYDTGTVASVNIDASTGTVTGALSGGGTFTDTISGFERLRGSDGNDRITGDASDDRLEGRNGADTLDGAGGNDTLDGGSGSDWFTIRTGATTIVDFELGTDVIDVQIGGLSVEARNTALRNATEDSVNGGSVADFGNGNTLRFANLSAAEVTTLAEPEGPGGANLIQGTGGDDNLFGTAGDDSILALGGNDFIDAGDGDDLINPGDNPGDSFGGDDFIIPGLGNDTVDFTDQLVGFVSVNYGFLDASGQSITVDIDGGANTGTVAYSGGDMDTFVNVNNPLASGFSTGGLAIRGTAGDDTFNLAPQGEQWMSVRPGDGVDTLNINGTGLVRVDFRVVNEGIDVNLATGVIANDGFGNVDTITGTGSVWEVQGSRLGDRFTGSSADESYRALGGGNTLDGGAGFDRARYDRPDFASVQINASTGVVTGTLFDGQTFTDTITGFEYLRGSNGDDTITGEAGVDNRYSGAGGSDTFVHLGGNDRIDDFEIGADVLDLRALNVTGAEIAAALAGAVDTTGGALVSFAGGSSVLFDGLSAAAVATIQPLVSVPGETVTGGGTSDTLTGTTGDDTIAAGAGNDTIDGGDGDDVINTGIGFDVVDAGGGNDLVQGLNGFDTLNGGAGSDTLQGNFGNDELNGGDGDDELQGGVGFDLLRGDAGADTLVGRDGFDTLEGGSGNDTLQGNAGNDVMSGGDDDDLLIGGIGSDVMSGDAGDDLLQGQGGFDTLNGGAGADTLQGNNSNDVLNGGEGDDRLEGGFANDVLNGDAGNDTLEGGNGFDLLNGGEGDDRLEGNAGNDTLDGGAGDDVLRGGLGADTFVFRVGSGNDTVLDLGNVDSVELEAALLGGGTPDAEDLRDISTLDADGFLLLDFGNGDTLTFTGITNTGAILDDVSFI